ncbi:MAG: TraX family protein, partial [Bacillota bacterium]|nr:TraX family protein [Bacillota bacterium]
GNAFWDPARQNVLFTLFIALLTLTFIKKVRSPVLTLILTVLAAATTYALKMDGSYYGVVMVVILYIFRENTAPKCGGIIFWQLAVSLFFHESLLGLSQLFAALAAVIIFIYNGKRGRGVKYFFYVFYPGHLLLLCGITEFVIIPFISA